MSAITFEVRDRRAHNIFCLDDALFDHAANILGKTATCVYIGIARHCNAQQASWPSILRLAEKLGISKRSVMRAIKKLEELQLIAVEKKAGIHNVYILLNKKHWKTNNQPEGRQNTGDISDTGDKSGAEPVTKQAQDQCQSSTPKGFKEGLLEKGNKDGVHKENLKTIVKGRDIESEDLINDLCNRYEPIRVLECLEESKNKRDPRTYFIKLLVSRAYSPSDKIHEAAKDRLRRMMKGLAGVSDLTVLVGSTMRKEKNMLDRSNEGASA